MKVIYLFLYYLLLFILLSFLGGFLAILAFVIPRIIDFDHNNFCNMDTCPTNWLRGLVGIELIIIPFYDFLCSCLFTRKFKKIFTKRKVIFFIMIWFFLLLYPIFATYITSFKIH